MARILVIDDSADMLDLLRMILKDRGKHEVLLSAEGQNGLALALAERPDLVIVDVMMPDIAGYDVVRRLRSNPVTADLRIIVLTARAQPIDRQVASEAGADAFITKPITPTALLEKVNEVLAKTRTAGDAIVIGVMGLVGGVGKTTIAVNLALLLQRVGQTLLMDLSPNGGHCALLLGLKPVRHWGFLFDNPSASVDSLLQQHDSGLHVLAAPPLPLRREGPDAALLDAVFDPLSRTRRFIVVDMPPTLNLTAQHTLERTKRLLIVSSDDAPAVHSTLRTLQVLESYRERTLLVLNAVRPGLRPSWEALQRALPVPIQGRLPYDEDQVNAARRASPSVLSQPNSAFVVEMQLLLRKLLS